MNQPLIPSPDIGSQATRPPRQRRKDARPSELSAAALELFVEKGFSATRLDDVAAHAGVSKGTLYLYFDSKEALFKSVIEESIVPLFVAAEQQMLSFEGSSRDLLCHLLVSWWQQIGGTRLAGVSKLIISESSNFPEVAEYYRERVIERGRALMRTVLQRGIERGEFRALEIETAIDVIFSPMLMLVVSRFSPCIRTHGDVPETFIQTYFDLLTRGLCRQKDTES